MDITILCHSRSDACKKCAVKITVKLKRPGSKHSAYMFVIIDTRLAMSSTARAATNDSKSPFAAHGRRLHSTYIVRISVV